MDVYIDFKSPAAYLAVKPTIELARQYQAAISWHPIKTRQPRLPAIQANEVRGEAWTFLEQIQELFLPRCDMKGNTFSFNKSPAV